MSNSVRRPELRGLIIQCGKGVGGLDLPQPCELFIEQFAREYASLGLSVTPVKPSPSASGTGSMPQAG